MCTLKCRVKLLQRAAQKIAVEVGIDFCGGNAFVAQHFLHGPQGRRRLLPGG